MRISNRFAIALTIALVIGAAIAAGAFARTYDPPRRSACIAYEVRYLWVPATGQTVSQYGACASWQ